MNQWQALPSRLIQQASLPSSVVYFCPLFSFLSSWSLLFPLSAAFRTVLSSCQGNESESPLSATTLFLCLTLPFSASVRRSSVCTLLSEHTSLWPPPSRPMMSHGEQRLSENDPGSNRLVSSAHICSFFSFRRVLPLFGENVSCFKKSFLAFYRVSKWLPNFLFLSQANLMRLSVPVIMPQSLLLAPVIEWSRLHRWLLINFHVLFSFFQMISSEPWQWWNVLIRRVNGIILSVNLVLSLFLHGWLNMLPVVQLAGWISWIRCSIFVCVHASVRVCIMHLHGCVCAMAINDGLAG